LPAKPIVPPPAPLSLAVAALLYVLFWPINMQDMGNDYVPWLTHIVDAGPLGAFAAPFAAYTPPYLYLLALVSPLHDLLPLPTLVKLVSLAGTLALAGAVWRLLRTLEVPHTARWAALTLALPTTALNAGLLGQSDAMWAAPCLMALDATIRRRRGPMLLWCGLALAFKMQAVLFAPFVAAVLIHRRVNPALWLLAPAGYAAAMLPAALLGWPVYDLAMIYARQATTFPALSLNAPNIWFLVQTLMPGMAPQLAGLAIASAVGVSACYIARFSAQLPGGAVRLLPVALLANLVTAGLLPHMHERYFFLADLIALIWAVASRERRAWHVALLIQAGSTLSIGSYLFGQGALVAIGFACMAIATWLVAKPLLQPANDNPPMMHRFRRSPLPPHAAV
jgi:Gpi18-like mannosyltransferase